MAASRPSRNTLRYLPVVSILLYIVAAEPARAEFHAGAGVEHLYWSEVTQPGVEESGPLGTVVVGWKQPGPSPVRLGYEATFYGGYVDYEGTLLADPDTPASGTTSYVGMAHEAALRVRVNRAVDVRGGLGLDIWLRRLGEQQREDFTVVYFRLGAEAAVDSKRRWLLGGGFKFPVSTSEDAHLDFLGFDGNPMLEPAGKVSGYVHLAYRFQPQWSLAGYLDGYQFDESPPVTLTGDDGFEHDVFQPAADLGKLGLRLVYSF